MGDFTSISQTKLHKIMISIQRQSISQSKFRSKSERKERKEMKWRKRRENKSESGRKTKEGVGIWVVLQKRGAEGKSD